MQSHPKRALLHQRQILRANIALFASKICIRSLLAEKTYVRKVGSALHDAVLRVRVLAFFELSTSNEK